MKAILTATWAAVIFITSIPVSAAQPEWDTRSVRVDYSDLDLTRAPGVSTLKHRVTGAIHQVCDGPAFELREKMQQRACERGAGTGASSQVKNAITSAKQLPSPKSELTASVGAGDKAGSSSRQQIWNRENRIPRR